MLKLKPEFLSRDGKKFVVLTVKEFDRMKEAIEDAEDLRAVRQARRRNANSPGYTLAEVRHRLGLSRPRKSKLQ